jgi:Ca-activated chloride channel family protein
MGMKRTMVIMFVVLLGCLTVGCSVGSNTNNVSSSADQKQMAESPAQVSPTQYDAMNAQDYGTNPSVSADEDRLSTFAIDVDTGSYTLARSYIEDGYLPPREAVRPEEFINYFDINYDPPEENTFAIHIDAGPSPFGDNHTQLVRIGIKGKEIDSVDRKRANLTFVIDVSGSMDQDNRIGLVKRSLRLLVNELNPNDRIGIVVYGDTARTVLEPTSIEDGDLVLDAIDGLRIEGSTNVEAGLLAGYKMASKSYVKDEINRVILSSDGVANMGNTDAEGILNTIEDYAGRNIFLSTFGFGMNDYNDVLMEQLADKGNGTYAYIDDIDEAKIVFQEQLTGTLQTIAKDAKIQVDFDPEQVDRYRLVGYENRAIDDDEFRNNKVDGGEVGAGHSITALYEVELNNTTSRSIGKVTIRYKNVDLNNKLEETTESIRLSEYLTEDTQFIASVAEFAKIIKEREEGEEGRLKDVLRLAQETAASERQQGFINLMERAIEIDWVY